MTNPTLPSAVFAADTYVSGMLAGGCLAAGAVLTLLGTWQRTIVKGLVAKGKRTTATAVQSKLHTPAPDGSTHHVVWRFQTEDGTFIEHEGLADALHHPAEHDTARVIYDPEDPHNARLSTFAERTLAWALFFYAGITLLAVGVIALVVAAIVS
ncbi:DUF3592 domain-containing protein [Aquihabitans sp. G128]|uniref:DUF3592 domain-containing protein n=1 Tax=Aquihabitans sp. G128 TaxID=2849779 RepID=UPI001C217245|nr:DUF3592 domain-containing protein [Aquihabitans sp. G128]QXC61909.1 DUF3592 domain-containing protein [Aquihabitans sp. G128]